MVVAVMLTFSGKTQPQEAAHQTCEPTATWWKHLIVAHGGVYIQRLCGSVPRVQTRLSHLWAKSNNSCGLGLCRVLLAVFLNLHPLLPSSKKAIGSQLTVFYP